MRLWCIVIATSLLLLIAIAGVRAASAAPRDTSVMVVEIFDASNKAILVSAETFNQARSRNI